MPYNPTTGISHAFGQRVRQLRIQRNLTQQKLADLLGVRLSYVNKVENGRLNAGDYPSETFVHKLADALKSDEDELLLLSDRVPAAIRRRVKERPDAFSRLASLDDKRLDLVLVFAGLGPKTRKNPKEHQRFPVRQGVR